MDSKTIPSPSGMYIEDLGPMTPWPGNLKRKAEDSNNDDEDPSARPWKVPKFLSIEEENEIICLGDVEGGNDAGDNIESFVRDTFDGDLDDDDDDDSDGDLICQLCYDMTGTSEGLGSLFSSEGYAHHNWYTIQATAGGGCAFCCAIWDLTEHDDWDPAGSPEDGLSADEEDEEILPFSGKPQTIHRQWSDPPPKITTKPIRVFADSTRTSSVDDDLAEHPLQGLQLHKLRVKIPGSGWEAEGEVFYVVAPKDDPASRYVPARVNSKDLGPESVNRVRKWIDEACTEELGSSSDPELPLRVIDVERSDSAGRLYEPTKGERARYAALSYCWGGAQLTTNKSNLAAHLKALPGGDLAQTITDAIEVCRKIGIRYLWIDALCIIQDDPDDKNIQIASMGQIYKRATITIVAASARKATDGFLLETPTKKPYITLPLLIDDSTVGFIHLRAKDIQVIDADDMPVFQRAWTFQELMLSPRALIFDSQQMTLKDMRSNLDPVVETYVPFEMGCPALPEFIFNSAAARDGGSASETRVSEYNQWYLWSRIVTEFSARDITLFSDRLPALAGIATELARAWDDEYIAGMWRRTIAQDLAWYRRVPTDGGRGPMNPPKEERASGPSWSWATVSGTIEYDTDHNFKADADLVDYSVAAVSSKSPFGQIESGCIALDARLISLPEAIEARELSYLGYGIIDFPSEELEVEKCSLLYLGGERFLIVKDIGSGRLKRVGCIEIKKTRNGFYMWATWQEMFNLPEGERQIVILE